MRAWPSGTKKTELLDAIRCGADTIFRKTDDDAELDDEDIDVSLWRDGV